MNQLQAAIRVLKIRRDTSYLAFLTNRSSIRGSVANNGVKAIKAYHDAQHIATVCPREKCVIWAAGSKDILDQKAVAAAVSKAAELDKSRKKGQIGRNIQCDEEGTEAT